MISVNAKEYMNRNLLVSIVIPAYNEEKVVKNLLVSIKQQSYPKIEVIVIDDSSTDGTFQVARGFTSRVFTRKHAERSVQRNFGARKAKGKYLLFLDADMELSKSVVKECVEAIENDKNVGAIVIPEISVATNFWEEVKGFERSFYNLQGDSQIDAARFFRRDAFIKADGYDESLTGPEDWDLPETIRGLGFEIARVKPLIYHHERIASPFKVARKKYYYALKSHRYLKKHKISTLSSKTVYFLRPVFYKNWKRLISHPLLSLAMVFMLTLELLYGGVGFSVGKFVKK